MRCKVLPVRRQESPFRTFDKLSVRCSSRESPRALHLVLRGILSYVTLATQRSNGAAHLRYRWQWQQCGRFPLAIRPGNGGEIDRKLAGLHSQSYPSAPRSPPATALPVRLEAIVSTNQITRRCPRCGIPPLIAATPAP